MSPSWRYQPGPPVAYWLRISTLEEGAAIFLPVQLAAYHQRCLAGKQVNSGVTLTRKVDGWWRPSPIEEDEGSARTEPEAPVVGVDVGITHFLTTSTGKHYGSFQGRLAKRHQQDRAKRRRKAKLRACLNKKGVEESSPRRAIAKLARTVRQEITSGWSTSAIRITLAGRSPSSTSTSPRCASRRGAMNAYLYASNLGAYPQPSGLGRGQTGRQGNCSQKRLLLAGVPPLSLCRPEQSPSAANVLLWGSVAGRCTPTTTWRSTSPLHVATA